MNIFWKIAVIALIVIAFASFAVGISMYYWPSIPASPDPKHGCVYPLNNHGRYTYMTRNEYILSEGSSWVFLLCFAAGAAIDQFLDPFARRLRRRPIDPRLPPWRNQP